MEFFYHRPQTSKTQGRVTVAAYLEGNELVFGASKCSKEDQFKRATARIKAMGRAKSDKFFIHDCEVPTTIRPVDIFMEKAKIIADKIHVGHKPTSYLPLVP